MSETNNINERKYTFGKAFYLGVLFSFLIASLIFIAVFFYCYYVSFEGNPSLKGIYSCLADASTFPAVTFILFYLIMYVSKEGAFDAIVYSVKLVVYSVISKNIRETKLPATYREYREIKRSKKRASFSFLFISAIPFIISMIVFIALFYCI